jgi:hypothetical protein
LQQAITDHKISSLDGSYVSEETGEVVGVEVITRGYDAADIEAKVEFAKVLDINFEQIKG